ncbi:S-methyl-5-thioribose-1-phosphate isomerase [Neobacillus ginsengisoli]|uniref:Methylthioribose-1-phosphate isomerase n=1 Tax=Neobacillus ginsengisoli TaxID=904295 RepID=A0ABT9XWR9_9BACI|nr:S-methyl-5-thioribose-1-phosphate isomerase [Neobacillus ginsengisoli]MDQ0199710.1 methylthioribose-1-phosphate isomerase [Neobacillus ginsengisoli]
MSKLEQFVQNLKDQQLLLPIWFEKGALKLINQKELPHKEEILTIKKVENLAEAIRNMTIRGSGAIGIAGAWGLYLAALNSGGTREEMQRAARLLKSTRPTAVNLMKTIDEMLSGVNGVEKMPIDRMEAKLIEILERQLQFEHSLGSYGANLIDDGETVLTHCHSGALAGSGYGGRALSVIRKAYEQGKNIRVIACETRPYLQGARITAYELQKFGIPVTLITDNMSGYCMSKGMVQKVVVGSDRVAANGDLANKIGTYMHALAAKEHNIPFYTATSSHTIDFSIQGGAGIEVEFRDAQEVTSLNAQRLAPMGVEALYPSFDITPNGYLSGIITEKGVITQPYAINLQTLNRRVAH